MSALIDKLMRETWHVEGERPDGEIEFHESDLPHKAAARIEDLEDALASVAAWIGHWQDDVETGLKVTRFSLDKAAEEIAEALKGAA